MDQAASLNGDFRHWKIIIWFSLLVLVVGGGGALFVFWDQQGWYAGLYHSFNVVSSAGVSNEPQDDIGRLIVVLLIIFGASLYLWGAAMLIDFFSKRFFHFNLRARRSALKLAQIEGHYILCGYGRVGQAVARELTAAKVPYLIVELDEKQIIDARAVGELVIEGDATNPDILEKARLGKAAGIVATMDTDAENYYTVVVAHGQNPNLFIVARASDDKVAAKLLQAGADRIVSPYDAAGSKLAAMVVNPQLENYIDLSLESHVDLKLIQLRVNKKSRALGLMLPDLAGKTNTKFAAIIKDGHCQLRPALDEVVEEGVVIVALGSREGILALEEYCT